MTNIEELRIRLAPWLEDYCAMDDDEIDATLKEMDQSGLTIMHVPPILGILYDGEADGIRAEDLRAKYPKVDELVTRKG